MSSIVHRLRLLAETHDGRKKKWQTALDERVSFKLSVAEMVADGLGVEDICIILAASGIAHNRHNIWKMVMARDK